MKEDDNFKFRTLNYDNWDNPRGFIYWGMIKEKKFKHPCTLVTDWDKKRSKIYDWNDVSESQRRIYVDQKTGQEAYVDDLVKYHDKIYKIVDDCWRSRLQRNLVEFGENEDITITEDVMFESEIVGSMHMNFYNGKVNLKNERLK